MIETANFRNFAESVVHCIDLVLANLNVWPIWQKSVVNCDGVGFGVSAFT